jgi:hypothetical protein
VTVVFLQDPVHHSAYNENRLLNEKEIRGRTMNDKVSDYIQSKAEWQQDVCGKLRQMIFATLPDVEERLQYGKPHYLKNGSYAAVISVAKDKITFMLFNASELAEEKGFIRSLGEGERKAIDISQGQTVDYERLAGFLKQTGATL